MEFWTMGLYKDSFNKHHEQLGQYLSLLSFTVLVSSFLSCFPIHQNPNPFTCASHPLASLPDPPHRRLALLRAAQRKSEWQ